MKVTDIKQKQNKMEMELATKFYFDLKELYMQDNDFENSHYGWVVQNFFNEILNIKHLKDSIPLDIEVLKRK